MLFCGFGWSDPLKKWEDGVFVLKQTQNNTYAIIICSLNYMIKYLNWKRSSDLLIVKTFSHLVLFVLLKEAESGGVSANGCNKENGGLPVEKDPGGSEPTCEQVNNSSDL